MTLEVREVDKLCEHCLAQDMHCCHCVRPGFFPPDDCTCWQESDDVPQDDLTTRGIGA